MSNPPQPIFPQGALGAHGVTGLPVHRCLPRRVPNAMSSTLTPVTASPIAPASMNESPNADDPKPELLVHITAPTSAKHDLGYRLLAKNTIEFEPATRLLVGRVSWPEEDIVLGDGDTSLQEEKDDCDESRPAKRRHLDPEESLSAAASQQQTIPWQDFNPKDTHVESGGSSVPDSQSPYDITKSVQLLSSPPIACSTPQSRKRKIEPASPFTFPSQSPRRSARLQGKNRSFQLSQLSQPSQRSQGKRKKSQTSSPSVEISSDILSNPNTQTQSPTLSSLPESPYCFTPLNPTATTYTLVHTAPTTPDLPRLNLTPSPPQTQFSPASLTHPLPSTIPPFNPFSPLPTLVPPPYTILCPTPPTSSNPPQFPKQWSTYLERTNYLPRFEQLMKTKSRELRSWERGYWRMDLTRWGDVKEKSGFWKMVVGAVEEGRMGLCTVRLEGGSDVEERRGEARARKLGEKDDKGDDHVDEEWRFKQDWSKEMGGGNVVRVYCYGGAVNYVWAMLYTFSFKRTDGMVWIDSKEEEVLRF